MKKNILLNHSTLHSEKIIDILSKNKKKNEMVMSLLLVEQGVFFQKTDALLSYQNTNVENYPFILKDFFASTNRSVAFILKSLLELSKDSILHSLILDEPILLGYKIKIDTEFDEVINITISSLHHAYFNAMREGYSILLSAIKKGDIFLGLYGAKLEKIKETLSFASKKENYLHPTMMTETFDSIFKKFDRDSFILYFGKYINIVDYFISTKNDSFHYLYHSANLSEEKIIQKKELILPLDFSGLKESYISSNAGWLKKNGASLRYSNTFNFSISFYLKEYIFESLTEKSFLYVASTIKDYFSRGKYTIDMHLGKYTYNKNHPFILQNEQKRLFENSILKLLDARKKAKAIVYNVQKATTDSQTFPFSEWNRVLKNTNIFFGYFDSSNAEYSSSDIISAIEDSFKNLFFKIYTRDEASNSLNFNPPIKEELAIAIMINKILMYCYNEDFFSISESDISPLFSGHATFHTEMKDSIIIDFRQGSDPELSQGAQKIYSEHPDFPLLVETMKSHPYHNYYEIDKDALKEGSELTISSLTHFLSSTSSLSPLTSHRCGLKFRKLGQYRANGIYFSHTKTMGIDYRTGIESYLHELTHHIDLGGYHKDRNHLYRCLDGYFTNRILVKKDYYLRKEELIARAGEIAMLLRASQFEKLKKINLTPNEFLLEMEKNFNNSNVKYVMKTWNTYFSALEYLDIPLMIRQNNFDLIYIVLDYFESFWGNTISPNLKIQDYDASYDVNLIKIYPNAHYSYSYYLCEIYGIEHKKPTAEIYYNLIVKPLLL